MKTINDFEARREYIELFKRKCRHCGHTRILFPTMERIICDWCGHWIYSDNKARFKYELKERLNK